MLLKESYSIWVRRLQFYFVELSRQGLLVNFGFKDEWSKVTVPSYASDELRYAIWIYELVGTYPG